MVNAPTIEKVPSTRTPPPQSDSSTLFPTDTFTLYRVNIIGTTMSEQKTIGLAAFQAEGLTEVDPYLLAEGFALIGQEKQAHFRQAFRQHWRAMFWSMSLSIALIMDGEFEEGGKADEGGYDGAVSNAYFGLPSFKDYFGHDVVIKGVTQKYINPNWQTGLQNCSLPGGFLGLYLCGWAQERYGSRKTYLCGMALAFCCVPLFAFAQNLPMLLVAEAVSAIAWGMFSETSTLRLDNAYLLD